MMMKKALITVETISQYILNAYVRDFEALDHFSCDGSASINGGRFYIFHALDASRKKS